MNFIESENQIASLFYVGSQFYHEGTQYVTLNTGKPKVSQGETKSDIYVLANVVNASITKEFKISYKKLNADFLENKMSFTRAEEIFGVHWKSRIQQFTTSIQYEFEQRNLLHYSDSKLRGRTKEGSITLGWKFEIVNKHNGRLSSEIFLTPDETLEIYAGHRLRDSKRHARVNGVVIPNSGIAEYILVGDCETYNTAQDVINDIRPIHIYAHQNPSLFFACKAHNYNTLRDKMDGNRYLSVYVDWNIVNMMLTPTLVFNAPLVTRANPVKDKLLSSLAQINVKDITELNEHNLSRGKYIQV